MRYLSAPILFLAFTGACEGSERKTVEILWTDTGVFKDDRPAIVRDWHQNLFGQLPENISVLNPEVARKDTIAIPMPTAIPSRGTVEFDRFVDSLADGISARLREPVRTGVKVEIRTIQDIAFKSGYWDPWRQDTCVRFTEAVLLAMEKARDRFKDQAAFKLHGMVGSNGGYVATEAIVNLGRPILEQLTVVDARAYVKTVTEAARLLRGRLTIVNTGGDAAALPDMVAHLAGSTSVKGKDNRVTVIYMDPAGLNYPWAPDHLALFEDKPRTTVVKEMRPDASWTDPHKVTVADLRQGIIEHASRPGGVSFALPIHLSKKSDPTAADLRDQVLNDPNLGNDVLELKPIGRVPP